MCSSSNSRATSWRFIGTAIWVLGLHNWIVMPIVDARHMGPRHLWARRQARENFTLPATHDMADQTHALDAHPLGPEGGTNMLVAFAVSLTKLESLSGSWVDAMEVLAINIHESCKDSRYTCERIAFVNRNDTVPHSQMMLRKLGWRVEMRDLPVAVEDIQGPLRQSIGGGGCCGAAELLKLYSYTMMRYHRVIHLDLDTLPLKPLDPLLDLNVSLVYTEDPSMAQEGSDKMPVQGGFFIVRPDRQVFQDMVEIVRRGRWGGNGWEDSGIGYWWGGATIQGLLPYYYTKVAPPGSWQKVDRCVWNYFGDTKECKEPPRTIDQVGLIHFAGACSKPWSCLELSTERPACIEASKRWETIRMELERHKFEGEPSAMCPNGQYRPIPRQHIRPPGDDQSF